MAGLDPSKLGDFAECGSQNPPQWNVLVQELKGPFLQFQMQNDKFRKRVEELEAA